ncbi:MAG: hypothetical protein U0931_10885 [Vulcanimicrobiota bacterium]
MQISRATTRNRTFVPPDRASRANAEPIRQAGTPEWSAEDRRLLDDVLLDSSRRSFELMTSFSQTSEGNCASFAVIKAAMQAYGNDVIPMVQVTEDGYRLTLQDESQLQLTQAQLAQAARQMKAKGVSSDERSYAIFLYAALAQRQAEQSGQDYSRALDDLGAGQYPPHIAGLLGLEGEVQMLPVGQAPQRSGVVQFSSEHAVYSDNPDGTCVQDRYGSSIPCDGTDGNVYKDRPWATNQILGAFAFRARGEDENMLGEALRRFGNLFCTGEVAVNYLVDVLH